MKNKKAQIPTTITWVVAIIVIMLIMAIYLLVVGFMGGKKVFTGESMEVEVVEGGDSNLALNQNLFAVLNSLVEDEDKLLKDLVLESVGPYIDNEISDINNLDKIRPALSEEFFITSNSREKDNLVFLNSKRILNNFCKDYMLKIPQGIIKSDMDDFVSEEHFKTSNWKEVFLFEWTPEVEIEIPYKNNTIIIKYRQLENC